MWESDVRTKRLSREIGMQKPFSRIAETKNTHQSSGTRVEIWNEKCWLGVEVYFAVHESTSAFAPLQILKKVKTKYNKRTKSQKTAFHFYSKNEWSYVSSNTYKIPVSVPPFVFY